jgi:deoxycytidylate deaminase
MHRYLRYAMQCANEYEFDSEMDYNLCAVIVKGGSIISVGFNKMNTNAFVEHYADLCRGRGRDFCLSTHAEQDAVLKARSKVDLRGCKIFVGRRKKLDGGPGMARPCQICENVLLNYGIRKAYYTINHYQYGRMIIRPDGETSDVIIDV